MLHPRLSFSVLLVGAVVLFLVFFGDVAYTYTRIHVQEAFPSAELPLRLYPPFHPPDLEDATPPPPPPSVDTHSYESDTGAAYLLWTSRAVSVKAAFVRAYHAYEKYAPFPADELQPSSNRGVKNFNGWGVTMVDALDTMLLLGLNDEFQRAVSHVASINFTMRQGNYAPFFETTIRYLGGFLSAYAISKEPILLSRAEDLATRLLPAFDTASGLPVYGVNTESGKQTSSFTMLLAEIASCQMEYKYLAHLTGHAEFFAKVDKVMDLLERSQSADHGMWLTTFDLAHGVPVTGSYTVGALADSAYEYILKQYLLSNKTEHRLAEMYMKSMTGILENLVFISSTRNLLYVTDTYGPDLKPTRKFEHLSCFFPGLLALGAETLPESVMSEQQRELHKWAAEGLAHSCWVMYVDQISGLGAEAVMFESWGTTEGDIWPQNANDWRRELWMGHVRQWELDGRRGGTPPGVGNAGMPITDEGPSKDYTVHVSNYLLRPETLESMFVLYRTTKNAKWRDRGWQIWEAIESKTHTPSGYSSVYAIERADPYPLDSMPSYFLAETVKYAYLLAADEDPWPSKSFVLNTEAHPLPVFAWRDWERKQYGISRPEEEPAPTLNDVDDPIALPSI